MSLYYLNILLPFLPVLIQVSFELDIVNAYQIVSRSSGSRWKPDCEVCVLPGCEMHLRKAAAAEGTTDTAEGAGVVQLCQRAV